jgi:uncharacterized protein with ParB-like and HNH nuclease domain
MTAFKIEGAGYTIKDIFSDRFSFNIPNYQRPYAWTTEQTERLLDDLLDAMEDEPTDINEISPYFLGNIVLIKPLDKVESEVVDGQQRLTTLTILFAVLRKLRKQENLTRFICQPKDEDAGIAARSRLHLRERDRIFFEEYIQNSDGLEKQKTIDLNKCSDPQQNIIQNTCILLDRISKELPEESQKQRLTQFLLQRCYLVVVSTPDFDSAYRIFSVLNDRGLDLSITDILKADAIGAISQQKNLSLQDRRQDEDKYTRKWENLEQTLGRDDFIELFSHIRMIYRKSKLGQKVIEEFRKYVLKDDKNNNHPRHLIDEILEPFAEAFYDVRKCSFNSKQNSQEINQLFKWLQQIDHSDWIPPAILYLKNYRQEPDRLLLFYTHLERLAAGLMIQRVNLNERIKRYAAILQAIESNENLYRPDSPLQLNREEKQAIIKVLDGNIYQMLKIRLYILLRLDTAFTDGIPNHDNVTIEHVLPQNPKLNSQWIKWFPTQPEREKYVHRLGNLVLLSRKKNAVAQNFEFDVKKEKYFDTPTATFSLTIQILKETEWTPKIVEKRQKYLLEQLKLLWHLSS